MSERVETEAERELRELSETLEISVKYPTLCRKIRAVLAERAVDTRKTASYARTEWSGLDIKLMLEQGILRPDPDPPSPLDRLRKSIERHDNESNQMERSRLRSLVLIDARAVLAEHDEKGGNK